MPSSPSVQAGFDRRTVFTQARARDAMRHGDAMAALEAWLLRHAPATRTLVDVGCGDGRDMAPLLRRVPLAGYVGLDVDATALDEARRRLADVPTPWSLEQLTFEDLLARPALPGETLWMGLFLHHLPDTAKASLFARLRTIGSAGIALLAHDPVPRDGEAKADFQRRLLEGPAWSFLTPLERETLLAHFSRGHPASLEQMDNLAATHGFVMRLLYRDMREEYAVMAFICTS